MVVYPPWGLLTGFSQVISMKLKAESGSREVLG